MGDLPPEMLRCIKDYIRADVVDPEVTKACLVRYLDHWDTIRETFRVYRGQDFAEFMKTPLISVSKSRSAAEGFARNAAEGRVFTLYLHPGVRYLDFTKYYDAAGIVTYKYENEFVIPGNSRFVPRDGAPLTIDVYPPRYVPLLEEPISNNHNRPVLLYNVRGLNARVFTPRNTTRKNTGGAHGGKRRRPRRSRQSRSKLRKSR